MRYGKKHDPGKQVDAHHELYDPGRIPKDKHIKEDIEKYSSWNALKSGNTAHNKQHNTNKYPPLDLLIYLIYYPYLLPNTERSK